MALCFLYTLFFLLFIHQALATSNDSLFDDWLADSPISNLTALSLGLPTPPPEFHIASTIGGRKLRALSCLMVTIAALKTLALGDWDAKIIDGTEYTLPAYPEVTISVQTPQKKRNIQACYVNWAITVGVFRMIRSKKFELAAFELRWNDNLLGWVHVDDNAGGTNLALGNQVNGSVAVAKRESILAPRSDLNDTTETEAFNLTSLVSIDLRDDADEARLNATFVPDGDKMLPIYDVFVPLMGALSEMAPKPSYYRSSGIIEGLQGYAGAVCILPVIPLRTAAPFLEYRWIIRTLARIPAYMLEERRFGDINMTLAVDEVSIGFGALNHLPDSCMRPS